MINNKLVTIYKDNSFDKGWGLFTPYRQALQKNSRFKGLSISDVVKKITYATEILLILQDACLPRKIVEELLWVNKYIKISLVAKVKSVANKYSELKFAKVSIDENVSANYIGIDGKEGKSSYLITDEITAIDDTIEKVLLGKKSGKKYEWLNGVQEVYIIERQGKFEHKDLVELCLAQKINTAYICSTADYNKNVYDNLVKTSIKILVAKTLKDAIVFVKDNRLYSVNEFWGAEVITEIADIKYCVQSSLFENMKLKECLEGREIPSVAYYIDKRELSMLSINENIVVERTVASLTMQDFLEENFDRSETNNHNDYCFKAKRVDYRFTLVPPIYDSCSYSHSNIYSQAKDIFARWKKNYTIDLSVLWADVKVFGSFQSWGDFLAALKEINEYLYWTINEYNYSRYPEFVSKYIEQLKDFRVSLQNKFLELHNSIAGESSTTQFSKFDEEIAGYKRTIEEKTILIKQGKDVISNRRRIEILEKKIEGLLVLKKRFESKSSDRESEGQAEFIKKYNDVLKGKNGKAEIDSVSNIVNTGELTKTAKLNLFLDKWLKRIDTMLEQGIAILEELATIDVPEDYVVYDKEGKRYIIIEKEEEYTKTLALCNKYQMECITRR